MLRPLPGTRCDVKAISSFKALMFAAATLVAACGSDDPETTDTTAATDTTVATETSAATDAIVTDESVAAEATVAETAEADTATDDTSAVEETAADTSVATTEEVTEVVEEVAPQCTDGDGACNNATYCGFSKADMGTWEGACAASSFGAAGPTATCMKGHGLTQACADCWGAVAACGAAHCLTDCIADSGSAACRECTLANCEPAFATCSGI